MKKAWLSKKVLDWMKNGLDWMKKGPWLNKSTQTWLQKAMEKILSETETKYLSTLF